MSIELGLDRLESAIKYLPKYTRPTIHIAGTNGKGSVAAFVHSILLSTYPPLSVGRFNSPHLLSVEDSIVLGDQPVPRQTYLYSRERVEQINQEHGIGLSSFEVLTLTALVIFEEAQMDVVVVEVGMGGRLDATNVIPTSCILVSALTAVDLDHQAFLGSIVDAIAKEKAGIAREGRPFVLGPQKHETVINVVRQEVERVSGQLIIATRVTECTVRDSPGISGFTSTFQKLTRPSEREVAFTFGSPPKQVRAPLKMAGDHQLDNLGTAITIVSALSSHPSSFQRLLGDRLDPPTIVAGIAKTKWPGRLSFHMVPRLVEVSKPEGLRVLRPFPLLVDGAHNAASATTLSTFISEYISQATPSTIDKPIAISLTYILGLSHSPPKTPRETLSPLLPPAIRSDPNIHTRVAVACVPFSQPEGMPWVKSVPPADVKTAVEELMPDAEVAVFETALQTATFPPPEPRRNEELVQAVNWASNRVGAPESDRQLDLVVLAGSLYLVADLYRLIDIM